MVTEADAQMVDLAFYAIQRRYQLENLRTIDREEWPTTMKLLDFEYSGQAETNYYYPHDYFIQLGEWLRYYREQERKKNYDSKQKQK